MEQRVYIPSKLLDLNKEKSILILLEIWNHIITISTKTEILILVWIKFVTTISELDHFLPFFLGLGFGCFI